VYFENQKCDGHSECHEPLCCTAAATFQSFPFINRPIIQYNIWRHLHVENKPGKTFIYFCETVIIHSALCLATGPQPFPTRVVHTVRSTVSSFNFHYPLFSLRSSSSCLNLLPLLYVTSNLTSTFPSITCFRMQFLREI
jgi:hypothetical protein